MDKVFLISLPAIDPPVWLWILPAAAFWMAVIIQWLGNKARIRRLDHTTRCTLCGESDAHFTIEIVDGRSGHKVGLLKNIWGGMMLLSIAGLLFVSFYRILLDLLQGSNATGMQNETLLQKIGVASFPLIVGVGCAMYGIPLLDQFLVGKKDTRVRMTCNAGNGETVLEG